MQSSLASARDRLSALASASPLSSLTRSEAPSDSLLEAESSHNKLLQALREEGELRSLFLAATNREHTPDVALCLLLPQSSTLDDVEVTVELFETHLVLLQRNVERANPRSFTSLNGLCGTLHSDGSITVHGRVRRATDSDSALGSNVGGWGQGHRGATIPQLESQIMLLRESKLHPSAQLPLASPVRQIIISDPLFFPGCGWKLRLALRRCTHCFRDVKLEDIHLSELPELLYEYQVTPLSSLA